MSYASTVLGLSPYRYWRMGGASSPVADQTSGGTLAVTNGTFGAAGGLGGGQDDGAVSFNGSSSFASAALDLSDTQVITLAALVKWNAYNSADDKLLAEYTPNFGTNVGGFIIDMNNSTGGAEASTVSVAMSGTPGRYRATFPQASLPAAAFHHLAIVFDRATPTIKTYVDGTPVTMTSREDNLSPDGFAASTLYFASRAGTSLFGACTLDEISIHKSELSSGSIAALVAAIGTAATTYDRSGAVIVGP